MQKANFTWKIDFTRALGRRVIVETMDGSRRKGEFTELRTKPLKIFDREVDRPEAVVLNNDNHDAIPVEWIRFMEDAPEV